MVEHPVLKYVPLPLLICPCCTRKKKPFKSFKSLNVHLAKQHPEYEYKIEMVKNDVTGNKNGRGNVIVKTRKSSK